MTENATIGSTAGGTELAMLRTKLDSLGQRLDGIAIWNSSVSAHMHRQCDSS